MSAWRNKNQVFYRVLMACFQYVHETGNITVDIRIWIDQRIPYTGLCRQMDHGIERVDERTRVAKPAAGTLALNATFDAAIGTHQLFNLRRGGVPGEIEQFGLIIIIALLFFVPQAQVGSVHRKGGKCRTYLLL